MPKGFIGNAAATYLNAVDDALSAAITANNKYPFRTDSSRVVPFPTLTPQTNVVPSYPPENAYIGEFESGQRNSSNIVVDESIYSSGLNRIVAADEQAAQRLREVAEGIEDLCKTSFIVPDTVVECMIITVGLKNSLGKFTALTEDAQVKIKGFVEDILSIG